MDATTGEIKMQHELTCNKHLPYYSNLKEEAIEYLREIKGNISLSLLLSESNSMTWIESIVKFTKLYGRYFSKDDHIYLIKLFLEVIITPGLDLRKVHWFIVVLYDLLRKSDLLSPDDLTIEWRPLYELYIRMFYNSKETYGLHVVPDSFEFTFKHFIKKARIYFPKSATKEILDELRPYLCVYNTIAITRGTVLLNLFLPTLMKPEDHDKGFKLWLEEFLTLWDTNQNNPSWEQNLVNLFSRLAQDSIGYIDWDPWIPKIFTHLLRSCNLIGGSRKVQMKRTFNVQATSMLIISLLGGPSSVAMSHVAKLFSALESYYHPSNIGKWNTKLSQFLCALSIEFINRISKERYQKKTWMPEIPSEYKLTDKEITEFVNILKPIILIHMFSRSGERSSAYACQLLSTIRPELIIPPLIDKMYSSMENLIEPHRLISSLQCVFSVSRNMVISNKHYPEGQTHVIPLLFLALPGLDPNDIKKCMITFQFISTFVSLIPLVDCSSAVEFRKDLAQTEYDVCLATSQWEDFVFQFIERCFLLIENSSFEHRPERRESEAFRINSEEGMTELGLTSSFNSILNQCSPQIFERALDKVYCYLSNRIFEEKVSGKFAANICRCFTKVNPELTLKKFWPHFSKQVLHLTESDDVLHEDHLDQQLVFNLLVLSEIVRCDGHHLLNYKDSIVQVLRRTLLLKSRYGYSLACSLLHYTLKSLAFLYPLDYRSIPQSWIELSNFSRDLPIHYWGKAGDNKTLNIKWHEPSDDEIHFAQLLLDEFLLQTLKSLEEWVAGNKQMCKEELTKSLTIIFDCLSGVSSALPMWKMEKYDLPESCDPRLQKYKSMVPSTDYSLVIKETGMKPVNFSSGENIRKSVSLTMRAVCKHIQEHYEDDTKALNLVIKIIHTTLFSWGVSSSDLDTRWKTYHLVKKATENKLDKSKRHIRVTLIDRVMLQHELRLKNLVKGNFTTLHAELLQDILALSVSHYSGVRMAAQDTLFTFFKNFNCSHFLVLPKICEILSKNNESTHEELKGALHILLGKKEISMISIPEWDLLNELWLALVNSQYSEKASIITLMSKINETVQKDADGHWVNHFISKSCKETAKKAWSEGIKPLCECPSNEQIKESEEICEKRNEINLDNYNRLVKGLSRVIDDRQLHWRKIHLAFDFLCLIIRGDVRFPKEGVQTIVKNLNSETLSIRKSSINGLAAILKQQKCTHPKFKFNPIEHQMEDNQWLQYRSDVDYCRAEVWHNTIFVEKNYIGFYAWPKEGIDVYEPEWKQPNINRALDELDDEEKPIFEFFTTQTSVDTLFSFLSLEERKGHDKFSAKRFQMFKGLFRNFGPTFLPKFKEKILSFVSDPHESKQRCAAEVIAGLVRGSKHWPLKDILELKHYLEPLIESMLSTMTTETFRDWGTCVATCFNNRDGRKLSWFVKLLVEDPLQSKQMCLANETTTTSFLQASRIYCILGVVQQQSWRALNLLHSLLEYLKDKDHLTNAYENVRERIGFLLCTIFVYDVNVPCLPNTLSLAPKRAQFIEHILPKVMKAIKRLKPSTGNSSQQLGSLLLSPEQKQATNLLKIVCRWIMSNFSECPISIASDFFRLLPILCEIQSETQDDGIVRESYLAIIVLSHAMLTNESLRIAVNTCKEMMTNKSWHTRSALTVFLECLVSSNLFIIMNDEKLRDEISEIVIALLEDERVEVREIAAHTLSSLVHCEFIKVNDALIERFERKCRKAIRKYRNRCQFTTTYDSSDLLERHSGVLGLCAIVNAYPYDVPEMLPTILMLLANHANDPQPISGTIVKTLSNFRRTHHDSWRDHKLKFSEDQLAVITDLLVSPSYYA